MSAEKSHIEFEPLPIRKRALVSMDPNQYIISDPSGKTSEIKANTAYEAFRMSGLKDANKIERLFIFNKNILTKSILAEDVAADQAGTGNSLHDRLQHLKSPIISADQLDELMRAAIKESAAEEAHMMQQEPSDSSSGATSTVPLMDSAVVPEPGASAVATGVPSPIGMDVHGDGFDEIIPSTTPVKPPAPLKHAEAKEEAPAAAAPASAIEPVPERELSADEVEKLLGGKPE